MDMVQLDGLAFGYGGTRLFDRLSLRLEPGNVYGLLGLNGAGKSTLLRLMAGLLFADRGAIRVGGRDPARRAPELLADLFVLPEELHLPDVSQARYVGTRAPFYPAFDRDLFERCADGLALPRGQRLTALSHGQKKKFMLAFGLASGASLLLLDEPTNGLDIPSKARFRRLVAEALTDSRTVVISTHQVADVSPLIDPVVILHDGRVLLNQSLARIGERVRMVHGGARPDASEPDLLYSEPTVSGHRSLWAQPSQVDGHVDLELLFNALVARPDAVQRLFEDREVAA
jgi:ABC-2 type transport system ATP-binding protein